MNINKVLHWVSLVGLFIVPFLPLLVSANSFFPFITGKNFAFRVIVEIIFASWLILALRDKNYWPKKSYLLYSILALLVVTGLATIFSENPYRSFWSNYERMGGYLSLIHLGAYFLVLISILRKKIEWFWLANISIGVNWLITLYSFSQLLGVAQIHQGGVRIDATLGNATYLAVYLLFGIFISLYLLPQVKNNWARVSYGLTILVDLFFLYHTATRGTILGLLVGLIVFTLLFLIKGGKKEKQWAGGILLAVAVLIGGFLLIKDTSFVRSSPVLSRFASISATETTTQSRFLIWKMSFQGFKEHPVLGWGPENYQQVFSKYYVPAMWRQEPWFDRSHNVFFDWLIDAGLLGLLAYLSIFISLFYYLWFTQKGKILNLIEKGLITGLLFGYFFHNIFVFDNLISYLYFFATVAFVHFLMTEEEGSNETKIEKGYSANKKSLVSEQISLAVNVGSGLIIIILIAGLYYLNYQPWQVSRDLITAIHPQSSPEKSLAYFEKVFSQNTFGSGEAREQLVSKTMFILNSSGVSNEIKGKFVKLTNEQIKIQVALSSYDTRSYLFFGSYLTAIGNPNQGLEYLLKAKTLSPKKQQVYFELVGAYVLTQEAAKALDAAKKAYDLDQTYSEARKLYALVLFMVGRNNLADELITPIKKDSTYYNDSRFISIYEQTGNNQLLQEIKKLKADANQ